MVKREQIELLRRLPKDFTTEFETEIESFKIKDSQDNIINPAVKEIQEEISQKVDTSLQKQDQIIQKLDTIQNQMPNRTAEGSSQVAIWESRIKVPVDRQAVLNVSGSYNISSPQANTPYTTDPIDVRYFSVITFYIRANQPIDVAIMYSLDGTNFHEMAGVGISSSEFDTSKANTIYLPYRSMYYKVKVITGDTPPDSIVIEWVKGT